VARNPDRKSQILIRNSLMKPISLLIALFILVAFLPSSTLAQSFTDPWSEPLNLSHSGAATDPVMAVDGDGVIHVFWTDEFDGPMYTRGDEGEWSPPVPVSVPFEGYTPLLLADSGGYLHAFWIDENQVLRYANVVASAIPASGWNSAEILASSAVAVDAKLDAQDHLHLAYVQIVGTSEGSAGVYYRQSESTGIDWSVPAMLYQSPYFRKLSPEDAHVQVEVSEIGAAQKVYVTWDNRLRSRVFLASSADGGLHWGEPQEIDKPEQGGGSVSPSDLTVYAQDGKVLLAWQAGGEDAGCSQYYQWSLDGGESWQPRQRLSTGFFDCADHVHILKGQDGPIILLLESTQASLLAWDGSRWSDPQFQLTLTRFSDPETQQAVNLACLQPVLAGSQLIVVGCQSGEEGGDIWWLRRDLTNTAEWFPQESIWQPLTSVTRSQSRFLSLAAVADKEERIHVLWSRSSDAPFNIPDSALYYARWEGERLWSQPIAILSSPEEPADQPAVALEPADHLLVVWRRGSNGEIFFSQAGTNQAALPEEWSEPLRLSSPDQASSAPDILINSQGWIYVVYAVPVNEGRGLYSTYSTDGGETWSGPAQVFDAAAAGWTMLDHPRLALTGNGGMQLLWTRYTLRAGQAEPLALAYARSQDGGDTWSSPETVVESPVNWSFITGAGSQTVHRFWQELTAGQTTTLWHERSLDSGASWERIAPISVFGQAVGSPRLAWDRAGKLHLLQVVSQGTGRYVLHHWIWDGERWGGSGSLDLNVDADTSIADMAVAISPQGNLAVVLSGQTENQNLATREEQLFFTSRSVELPEGLPTPIPPVLVTPVVTEGQVTVEPTASPTSTPTPDLAAIGAAGGSPGNSWSGLVIGGVLAGLIVAAAFGFGVWKAKGG
jgi:hypothetical protein